MRLRLEVVPTQRFTRLMIEDPGQQRRLGGRLSAQPANPMALLMLAEALALWWGRPMCVALSVAGPGVSCATTRWGETLQEVVGATDCVAVEELCERARSGFRHQLLFEVGR